MVRFRSPSRAARDVLGALVEAGPAWSHGYELCRSTGVKSGTLYPLLIRLERQGCLEAVWLPAEGGRPPRHAYRLTAAGFRFAADHLPIPSSTSGRAGQPA